MRVLPELKEFGAGRWWASYGETRKTYEESIHRDGSGGFACRVQGQQQHRRNGQQQRHEFRRGLKLEPGTGQGHQYARLEERRYEQQLQRLGFEQIEQLAIPLIGLEG